jgi:cytoskeleton protein RodZ
MPAAGQSTWENRLPSFGEKLKSEREKRAITLEQISLSTKIGTRMLQALEEEKFDQLPGGIFNKGFVRAYARHLGLDEDQTVADYLEASGESPLPKAGPDMEEAAPPEAREQGPSRQLPWGIFAALLLLVALALSVWSHRQRKHAEQSAQPRSAPVAAPKPQSEGAAAPVGGPEPSLPSHGSTDSVVTPAPIKPAVIPPPAPIPAKSTERSAGPPAPTTAPETVAAEPSDEFTVVIQARQDSWVAINADGKDVLTETLSAGSQRAVRGRKEVIVKAGNAGGLDFLFNGTKLGPQGDSGQVKTLTFGVGGLQRNRSAPPSVE